MRDGDPQLTLVKPIEADRSREQAEVHRNQCDSVGLREL